MGGRRGIEAEVKILTLKNGYHLWAQKLGQGQHKLLCLHGGPGSDHELFEEFGKNLAKYDTEVYMYDQLGSYYSEHPDFSVQENVDKYANIDYFVNEVEEVRQLLGLEDFFLLGHSWGGILVQEYALKYGSALKGAIISDMTDDIASYVKNINRQRLELLGSDEVQFMEECEAQQNYDNERYRKNINRLNYRHIIKHPENSTKHLIPTKNTFLYHYFQGDNEFVVKGTLADWSVKDRLKEITIPTCLIFGADDSMDLDEAAAMDQRFPNSELHIIADAAHCSMIDNPTEYFTVLGQFIVGK